MSAEDIDARRKLERLKLCLCMQVSPCKQWKLSKTLKKQETNTPVEATNVSPTCLNFALLSSFHAQFSAELATNFAKRRQSSRFCARSVQH